MVRKLLQGTDMFPVWMKMKTQIFQYVTLKKQYSFTLYHHHMLTPHHPIFSQNKVRNTAPKITFFLFYQPTSTGPIFFPESRAFGLRLRVIGSNKSSVEE